MRQRRVCLHRLPLAVPQIAPKRPHVDEQHIEPEGLNIRQHLEVERTGFREPSPPQPGGPEQVH